MGSRRRFTSHAHRQQPVYSADLTYWGVNRFAVVAEGDRPCDTRRRSRDWQGPEDGAVGSLNRDQLAVHTKGEKRSENDHATVGPHGRSHGEIITRDAVHFPSFLTRRSKRPEIDIGVKDIDRPIRGRRSDR